MNYQIDERTNKIQVYERGNSLYVINLTTGCKMEKPSAIVAREYKFPGVPYKEEEEEEEEEDIADSDSDWSCSGDYQDCTWDTECVVCSNIVKAGSELYAGGEIDIYSMCKECWERPQHDCLKACYLVNGLCPECHAEEEIVLK